MTFKLFFTTIQKITDLIPVEEKIIVRYLKGETYRRGDFLVKEGETSERVFFVVSGLIKEDYLHRDTKPPGGEVCTGFTGS
ncbi:hypothetical protein D9M68_957670 [compost metagenome]